MGEDKLTRGELIQYLEGYCEGHRFCIIESVVRCKLLDTYCGGMMDINDLTTQKLYEIYKYIKREKREIVE